MLSLVPELYLCVARRTLRAASIVVVRSKRAGMAKQR
jgi:hypothetical protein